MIYCLIQDPVFKNNPGNVDLKPVFLLLKVLLIVILGYKREFNKINNTYKDIPVKR